MGVSVRHPGATLTTHALLSYRQNVSPLAFTEVVHLVRTTNNTMRTCNWACCNMQNYHMLTCTFSNCSRRKSVVNFHSANQTAIKKVCSWFCPESLITHRSQTGWQIACSNQPRSLFYSKLYLYRLHMSVVAHIKIMHHYQYCFGAQKGRRKEVAQGMQTFRCGYMYVAKFYISYTSFMDGAQANKWSTRCSNRLN